LLRQRKWHLKIIFIKRLSLGPNDFGIPIIFQINEKKKDVIIDANVKGMGF
jgi:hypothetical protein